MRMTNDVRSAAVLEMVPRSIPRYRGDTVSYTRSGGERRRRLSGERTRKGEQKNGPADKSVRSPALVFLLLPSALRRSNGDGEKWGTAPLISREPTLGAVQAGRARAPSGKRRDNKQAPLALSSR